MRMYATQLLCYFLLASSLLSAQELSIHHIDVNQGDATLFVMPNEKTLLVDAGFSFGGEVIADYLDSLEISELDAFVLTHYDADHMGGVDVLVREGIGVKAFYDRGNWDLSECDEPDEENDQVCQYRNTVIAEAGSAKPLHPGDQLVIDSAVSVVVVASNGRVHPQDSPLPTDENGRSVTLLISYNGFNYLLGGDLTEVVEKRLVSEAAIGDVDVYHVNHHGSETSSSRAFLRLIRPEVAVISAGSHCGHHHPRQAVLNALSEELPAVEIFQTNRYVCEGGPGGNVEVEAAIGDLEPEGAEGAIVIEVGEAHYTVLLARTGGGMLAEIQRP